MRNEKVYENLYKQAMERAEKAERERDELARHVEYQDDQLNHGPVIMLNKLRAKHWREAIQWLSSLDGFLCGRTERKAYEKADAIERGE